MSTRKKINNKTEADVLESSGRRCCLCYGLNNDFEQKQGQIAHLDRNRSNDDFDNLCFMCLSHHDQYDTRTSQSKGYSIIEVKRYRSNLYRTIELRRIASTLDTLESQSELLLTYCEEVPPVSEVTIKGIKVVHRNSGLKVSSQNRQSEPFLILSTVQKPHVLGVSNILGIRLFLPFGCSIFMSVMANSEWAAQGFINTLRKRMDLWVLNGETDGNNQDLRAARNSILVERSINGENRIYIGIRTMTESTTQAVFKFTDEVGEQIANYLEQNKFIDYVRGFED